MVLISTFSEMKDFLNGNNPNSCILFVLSVYLRVISVDLGVSERCSICYVSIPGLNNFDNADF